MSGGRAAEPELHPRLRAIVVDAVATITEVPVTDVEDQVAFVDLGLDSLTFMSVLVEVEERVGEEVPTEVFEALDAVGDLVVVGDLLRLLATWRPAALDADRVAGR